VQFYLLDVGNSVNLCDRMTGKESLQMNRDIFATSSLISSFADSGYNFISNISVSGLDH
jgi:hypothetical protein